MLEAQFRISLDEAAAVVVAATGMYLAFVVLIRLLGSRRLTSLSIVDVAVVVAVGAVIGRTPLLEHPRLITGVLVLGVFYALQWAFGGLRMFRAVDRLITPPPVVLVADGAMLSSGLQRSNVTEHELRQAARAAGVTSLAEVAFMVMEPNGNISVLKAGRDIDPWLTADLA